MPKEAFVEAEEKIATALKEDSPELNLSRLGLETLPESLSQLQNLKTLDLSHNQLSSVPKSLGQLHNLQELDLSHNQLSSVPESLSKLQSLERLYLSSNRLERLWDVGSLTALRWLIIDDNCISALPSNIERLPNLYSLTANNCPISELPRSLGSNALLGQDYIQDNVTYIGEVWLAGTNVSQIPEALLACFEEMALRDDFVSPLALHGTQIGIPPEILGPTNEEVRNGKNRSLPKDQQKKPSDPKRVARYLRQIAGGNVPRLNEAKLLVVGPGGAGKTSIIEQLLRGTFTPDTKISTHGVVVSRWDELRSSEDEPIRLNVWDFGGQEIQHSTHEFFLTERAVYLLVVNPRQDQRVQDEIYHWLDLIRMNAPDAPVIVALSQQDKFEGHVRDADSLDVVDFVPLSCVEEHEAHGNFPHLKELIEREVRKLEHVSNKLPPKWLEVKAALEDENEDFMTYADYRAKCVELGVDDEEDQQLLARFLHDLGVMLNYADKIPLEETHILNPRWVTEGVYGIVLSDELKATGGELEESLVAKLDTLVEKMLRKEKRLKADENYEPRYPLNSCRFVLAMMEQFELCHSLDAKERRYLVPNALPQDRPAGVNDLSWEGALRFQLHYPQILPTSVFSRFLVHIEAQPNACQFLWREGIVSDLGDCAFQVTMHDRDKQIRVVIKKGDAESRVAVLEKIRQAFVKAHGNKELNPVEWIPLPDDPGAGVERELLIKLARAGKRTHMVEGSDGELKEVVVEDLLGAIGEPRLVRELLELLQYTQKEEMEALLEKLELKKVKSESLGSREIARLLAKVAEQEGWEIEGKSVAELLRVLSSKPVRVETPASPTPISAGKAEGFAPGNCRRVLHLSDLHFTSDTTPETHLQWLATDLKSLNVDQLDAVVISGDFKDKADLGGFDRAKEFIKELCNRFGVDVKERCLIVPGNHDVQDLDEAYDFLRKKPDDLPDFHTYEERRGWLVRNETEHRKRLEPFSKQLHEPLLGRAYPLDPKKQGFVKTMPKLGLQFLLLNSAWELDEFARDNANILPESLASALKEADEEWAAAGGDLLRIGVWHHALATDPGGHRVKNPGILRDHLQKSGFKLGLHGDVHKLERQWIGYWNEATSLHIVGGGTFGAPDRQLEHSKPRLYNLLLFKEDGSAMRVHTRAQETVDGGWDAWAKWPGPDSDAKYGYFDINFD